MKLPFLTNIGNFFPKLRPRTKEDTDVRRPFSVVQIEVTSRCDTGCVFCPHEALADSWQEGDITIDLFREDIAPHLDLFDLVYLQGWGEPMLHPDLWDMLSLAQEKNCRTGFTTNGSWLEESQNERLVDTGVNMISVSFAGTGAAMHESLRTHSKFQALCSNFENLANLKAQRGCEAPWLELHFLMTRANLGDFPDLIKLAASLGANEVVATNLTYTPTTQLDQMRIFSEQPLDEDLQIIDQAQETARELDIPLRIYPIRTEPHTLVCDADPPNTVFINHRGEVTPCVYLGLAVKGQIPRFFLGEAHPFEVVTYGNVRNGLVQVMHGEERHTFISAFLQRKNRNVPLAMIDYMTGETDTNELPMPPAPCQYCYKMLGV